MRVALLSFYHGLGHVIRSTRIASELAAAGADVVFASAESGLRWARAAGVPTAPLTELPPLPPMTRGVIPATHSPATNLPEAPRIRMADSDYLQVALAEERSLIRNFRADFVLADFRVTGPISAALEGVSSGSVVNMGFFSYPFPDVIDQVKPELTRLGVPPSITAKPLGDIVYIPDRSLFEPLSSVGDTRSIEALRSVDEVRHTGPVLKIDPRTVPSRAEARLALGLDAEVPLVYISLGGTAQGYGMLRTMAPMLDQLAATTAVVTGPNIDPADLGGHAADRMMDVTDDSMLWASAADVVVTHGGHTSVMEALALGRPILALPGHDEQRWNAERAVALGAGEILDPEDIPTMFVSVLDRMLGDTGLHERAARVGEVLSAADGASELAAHVVATGRMARLRRAAA